MRGKALWLISKMTVRAWEKPTHEGNLHG